MDNLFRRGFATGLKWNQLAMYGVVHPLARMISRRLAITRLQFSNQKRERLEGRMLPEQTATDDDDVARGDGEKFRR